MLLGNEMKPSLAVRVLNRQARAIVQLCKSIYLIKMLLFVTQQNLIMITFYVATFQCVNRIYHRDPISQLPSCQFASFPSMLDLGFNATGADDEIQEVSDSSATRQQNTSLLNASTSSTEDPDSEGSPKSKITCPICMDDELTVSIIITYSK